ncbi:TPA_asm: UL15 iORF 2 [Human alphaherpesvirus 1]|nr:TPA_asm: UL15 iORF 2 [Human alphaherpesvirus 1]
MSPSLDFDLEVCGRPESGAAAHQGGQRDSRGRQALAGYDDVNQRRGPTRAVAEIVLDLVGQVRVHGSGVGVGV